MRVLHGIGNARFFLFWRHEFLLRVIARSVSDKAIHEKRWILGKKWIALLGLCPDSVPRLAMTCVFSRLSC